MEIRLHRRGIYREFTSAPSPQDEPTPAQSKKEGKGGARAGSRKRADPRDPSQGS